MDFLKDKICTINRDLIDRLLYLIFLIVDGCSGKDVLLLEKRGTPLE